MILFALTFNQLSAKEFPDSLRAKNSLTFQLFGPEVFGVCYNHYLSRHFSLNAGIGAGMCIHIGFNYYPLKVSPFSLYFGGQLCRLTLVDLGNLVENHGSQAGFYLPVGLQYTAPKGFTLQFEGGYIIFKEDWGQRNTQPFLYTIRIGKTWFKQKK